jgi:hypothetical protein
MLIHCPMDDDEEYDSDLRQSRITAEISVGAQKQEEKIRIPPSVTKPTKRKRVDVGGKMYEDELMVLNERLKRYGYESTIALLRDFKDGIFPEDYFKPQGAINMGQNQSHSGAVSLIDGKPNPDFFNHIDYEKMYELYRNELKLSERYAEAVVIISNITGGYFLETILKNCRNRPLIRSSGLFCLLGTLLNIICDSQVQMK